MSRRTAAVAAAAALFALAGAAGPAGAQESGPGDRPVSGSPAPGTASGWGSGSGDHLAVSVADSDDPAQNGSYTVRCRPMGGDHPSPGRACAALDRATAGGNDPFRPVPTRANCTMVYGGPATAHVTGTWHGREVDARFKRSNGCEIDRWEKLVPALPKIA